MFCMQAFRALIHHAAYECDEHRLPQHVTILLDELPNLGYIPRLDHSLATSRKYRISTIMAAQTVGEMKQMYGEQTETILASCEAVVYMGSSCLASDENALKYASKWLGKTTIAGVQTSVSEETPEKEGRCIRIHNTAADAGNDPPTSSRYVSGTYQGHASNTG